MQACPKCGYQSNQKLTSCPSCGLALSHSANQQQKRGRKRQKGKSSAVSQTKICPDCGHEVNKKSKYCPACGVVFFVTPAKPVQDVENVQEKKPVSQKLASATVVRPEALKTCPECAKKIEKTAKSCPSCGLIFYTSPAKPIRPSAETVEYRERPKFSFVGSVVLLLFSAVAVFGLYHHPRIRILLGMIERTPDSATPRVLKIFSSKIPQYDLAIDLPAFPWGMIWNDREFLLGNHQDFLGLLILKDVENTYEAHQTPFPGSSDSEVFGIRPMAWNGKNFIGYSEPGLLEFLKSYYFTVHDPSSFRVLKRYPAPDRIGGLAWDGRGYWAANWTDEEQHSGVLYRLDSDFKVINKMISPSNRCKGLTWDGSFLWFIDEFSHKVLVLDVKGVKIEMVSVYDARIKSPNGIAFDGQHIWICDHDEKRLYRWNSTVTPLLTNIAKKRSKTDESLRVTSRRLTHYAIYRGSTDYPRHNAEINYFSVQLVGDTIFGSWKIHVGESLLSRRSRARSLPFAKYTVTIDGGSLVAPMAKVYDATPGSNMIENEQLATSVGPGIYNVCVLIYIQYLDEQRVARILSKTGPRLEVMN